VKLPVLRCRAPIEGPAAVGIPGCPEVRDGNRQRIQTPTTQPAARWTEASCRAAIAAKLWAEGQISKRMPKLLHERRMLQCDTERKIELVKSQRTPLQSSDKGSSCTMRACNNCLSQAGTAR